MGEKEAPYPHRSEVNKKLPVEEPPPNPDLGKNEKGDPDGEEED